MQTGDPRQAARQCHDGRVEPHRGGQPNQYAADKHLDNAELRIQQDHAEHAQQLQASQDETQELEGKLSACEERAKAELLKASAQGTTDALGVALGPELAEVQARAELVATIPRAALTQAIIEIGSDQLIAAEAWMARCEALQAIKETDRLGCGSSAEAVQAYLDALKAQAECPGPVE